MVTDNGELKTDRNLQRKTFYLENESRGLGIKAQTFVINWKKIL
jgi:hypothetical protein